MRNLIRISLGAMLAGTLLIALPTTSALADHDVGTNTNSPGPNSSRGTVGNNAAGWHEEMPDIAVASPEHQCLVLGTVDGGNPPVPSAGHNPFPPAGIDDPAHSHFNFLNTVITCDDFPEGLSVIANGGNDGHSLPWEGGTQEADFFGPDCVFQHEPNGHHGAMTESGWSHSSGFAGGSAACPHLLESGKQESNGGAKGLCRAPKVGFGNNNKANLQINGTQIANDFVKYIRLGNAVYFWGCHSALAPARRFSGTLAISPDPRTTAGEHAFPLCLVPGGAGCDLLLAGPSIRSNAWHTNNRK